MSPANGRGAALPQIRAGDGPEPAGGTSGLLELTLAVAVPVEIDSMRHLEDSARAAIGRECGQFIAEHGDDVQFRGARRGDSARAFTMLARGLAVAAFQPGGVTFRAQGWCAAHPGSWPAGAGGVVCPRCLAAECQR